MPFAFLFVMLTSFSPAIALEHNVSAANRNIARRQAAPEQNESVNWFFFSISSVNGFRKERRPARGGGLGRMDLESLTPFFSSATRAFARSVPTRPKLLWTRNFLGNARFFRRGFAVNSRSSFSSLRDVQFQDAHFPSRRH